MPRLFLLGFLPRPSVPKPVDQVSEGQERMSKHHPRACVLHNCPDLFAHGGSVTVNRTLSTRGLLRFEWAPIEPIQGVLQELLAPLAEFPLCRVSAPTGDSHHCPERLLFPR